MRVPKVICSAGPNSSSRESTPKSNKSGSNSPKSGNSTVATAGKSSSPPPVTYSRQKSDSSQSDSNGSQKNGGDVPTRRLSSTSDEIILNFSSSVDGYSRVSSTGSDVRDRCRDLLAKALRKGLEEGVACMVAFNLSFTTFDVCSEHSRRNPILQPFSTN